MRSAPLCIVSTVLSLVVVPSFFLIMDDLSRLLGRIFSRVVGKKEEEPEAPSAEELGVAVAETGRAVQSLDERLAALESKADKDASARAASNIRALPNLAAE